MVGDYGAILTLVDAENPGAAFKLFRLLYEDVINALWVQAFAKPSVVKKLLHGKSGKVPDTMATRTEKLDTILGKIRNLTTLAFVIGINSSTNAMRFVKGMNSQVR